MSAKPSPKQIKEQKPSVFKTLKSRDGLGPYIAHPESFPPSNVIYHTDDFVVINDLYPKASLHLLLLPRDPVKSKQHPFDAFEDPLFLEKVKTEASKLRKLAAAELRRKYAQFSAQEQTRSRAMDADPPPDELPAGRDWEKEIMCGIHACPSMNHLHVHVMSVDRYSGCLKHRKHYNSFATPFFVDIDAFPLAEDDERRHPDREGYLKRDFKCWRCREQFGNKFNKLKDHLEVEFDRWKRL